VSGACVYNYFRNYDPTLGRYVQSDPIGLNGGINSYAYVALNPLMGLDRYGLAPTDWDNTSGGRSALDGPTNGNWGGKCWSGGQYSCGPGGMGSAAPTDSGDVCYMHHDYCYDKCKNAVDKSACIKACDRTLCKELKAIGPSSGWPQPPSDGTADDADSFRRKAMFLFCPNWTMDSGPGGAGGRRN
jgi:hypothetical protein